MSLRTSIKNAQALWRKRQVYELDWKVYQKYMDSLRLQILDSLFYPTTVIAIARGGLIPAVCLSNALGCSDMRVLSILRNCNNDIFSVKHEPRVSASSLGDLNGQTVLLVDDIVGGGMTMASALDAIRAHGATDIRTASIVRNCSCALETDYCAVTVDDWVIFPWETSCPHLFLQTRLE